MRTRYRIDSYQASYFVIESSISCSRNRPGLPGYYREYANARVGYRRAVLDRERTYPANLTAR